MKFASIGIRELADGLADSEDGVGATLTPADSAFVRVDRIVVRLEAGDRS